jgi:hypothetical protein
MKIVAFWLILSGASCTLFGGDLADAPVGIYAAFDEQPPINLASTLEKEIKALLAPLGFATEWRPLDAAGQEVWADLAIVHFRGPCELPNKSVDQVSSGALGWTSVADGEVQPFAFVDCGRIRAFVKRGLAAQAAWRREGLFQRAIARVLAHELYHVLARTTAHGSSGIGEAEITVRELLSDDFHFEGRPVRRLLLSSARALVR